MKKQYRSRRTGRYVTKRYNDAIGRVPLVITGVVFTVVGMFSFALIPSTVDVVFSTALAASTFEPLTDICGLDIVECEGEYSEAVQREIDTLPHTSSTTEKWVKYIYDTATAYGIPARQAIHTVYCESQYHNIQSHHVYPNGVQEDSHGIWQISHIHHPGMIGHTYDAYASTDYAIANWYGIKWYAYDRATDTCTNGVVEYWQ